MLFEGGGGRAMLADGYKLITLVSRPASILFFLSKECLEKRDTSAVYT